MGNLSALRLRFKPEKCLPPESMPYRCLQRGIPSTPWQQRKGSPWWKGRGARGGGFPERGLPEKVRDELGMGGSVERKSKHLYLSTCSAQARQYAGRRQS